MISNLHQEISTPKAMVANARTASNERRHSPRTLLALIATNVKHFHGSLNNLVIIEVKMYSTLQCNRSETEGI